MTRGKKPYKDQAAIDEVLQAHCLAPDAVEITKAVQEGCCDVFQAD